MVSAALCTVQPAGSERYGRAMLAAIGICLLAAISGYQETASFVTERDYGILAWPRRNRLVRSSLEAVRIGAG
ncbi:MAG: hypothetical protein QOH50_1808 [Kribbellaceae bacterium]|nr:hypothetical protein [Kribbellaceae bacterium]